MSGPIARRRVGWVPRGTFLTILFLVPTLILGFSHPGAPARDLDSRQEAVLFSLADLGPVDLSPKTVTVEVYVSPFPELAACQRMLPLVWQRVQEFYARMDVNLVYVPGGPHAGPLAPGKRLRIELLTDKLWLARSFKAFQVEPPFRLRFLQVCLDKCAFAHLPLSTIHISFQRFQKAEFSTDPREADLNRYWLANLLIHELGHLMGLYHSHEFVNDPVAISAAREKVPNFMSHHIAFQTSLGFGEFQKHFIHSYLGGGKVFQQYRRVDFDPLRYLELVKRCNGFREPPPAKAKKMAHRLHQGKVKTFDDDDDDEDD